MKLNNTATARILAESITKKHNADEYRVDVLMDKLCHKGRTRLYPEDFSGSLADALEYAFENTTSKNYKIVKETIDLDGAIIPVTITTIYFK